MVVTALLQNVATNAGVLVALVLVYAALSWPFEEADRQERARRINRRRLVCGLLFGLGAILTMNLPVTVVQGVIVDGKTVILSLAGAYLHPLGAGMALLVAGSYRWHLGGAGVVPGVAILVGVTLLGLVWGAQRKRMLRALGGPASVYAGTLWLFSLGLACAALAVVLVLLLPAAIRLEVLQRVVVPVMLIFPPATLAFGWMFEGVLAYHARGRAINAMLREQARAAEVFLHARDGIVILDEDETFLDANPAFCAMTGFAREELLGRSLDVTRPTHFDPALKREVQRAIETKGHFEGNISRQRKNGEVFPCTVKMNVQRHADGRFKQCVVICTDQSEAKRYEEELKRVAHYDPLTGLPNRSQVLRELQVAMAREPGGVVAVVYADLDDFSQLNEQWGKAVGDQLICELGQHLKAGLQPHDTFGRVGGDEFVFVLPRPGDVPDVMRDIDQLANRLRQPVQALGHTAQLTASMGVTFYPQDSTDADTLLRHADLAMYTAKDLGKNQVQVFDPSRDARVQQRRATLLRIEQAMKVGELELFFQPKMRLSNGSLFGAEALLRWRHPERGLLAPGAFLDEITGTPFSEVLDRWVAERALQHVAQWREAGQVVAISVNMAVPTLTAPGFIEFMEKLLLQFPQLPIYTLEIEILEYETMNDLALVAQTIERLYALGVRVSIDDFGTGYSSLSYLQRLPAQFIKIDQSFVRDMLSSDTDRALVQAIVGLAKAFGREAVAEGVETHEHAAVLGAMGCDIVQGYGIARPMPAADLLAWVSGYRLPALVSA
ncbi:putative bifunctional diguanylate cyclase/phosphodiesterase [Hydrogenophaga defluvii]|uniref:Bifunctional diguanylate cyclase/phosphodiesterase n=1 Tax=Hydrogenophaga defluvii TaxID=249410 RepID=A0ABW2S803_9BURK